MTVFAVQPGSNMRAMIEMYKIRHLVDRNPFNRYGLVTILLSAIDVFLKFLKLFRPFVNRYLGVFLQLAVACPAFLLAGQSRRGLAPGTRMTIQTWDLQIDMHFVRKLDGLLRRDLGLVNHPARPTDESHDRNQ